MAPPSENDNTPKAPDKTEKFRGDKHGNTDSNKEKNQDFKTLNNLNDCELRDLLDEAITYKNPKDREGKSTLFKELLSQAEESERNARAASAGGSEQVRYCNTSAKRSKHRRKPNSISENVMHGGSLDNLAKEELFEVTHHLNRPKRTVSARQREGGSLPSNVNAGSLASYDPHFLEEARRKRTVRGGVSPEPMDVDMETVSLLEHDSVAENFDGDTPALELIENSAPPSARHFTTNATLQVNVDDALHFNDLDPVEKKPYEIEQIPTKVVQTNYSVFIQNYPSGEAGKKVDENGNALHQNTTSKGKKKKVQADKNVVSCVAAEKVEGHRSDIIDDVDKLVQFIGENDKHQGGTQNRTNAHRSNKHLHKHTSEEGPRSGGKKQRAQSSKGKENRSELKKSNSLGEISTTKLDHFEFDNETPQQHQQQQVDNEVVLRTKKDSANDKPRERRSWGNAEHHPAMQNFYRNPSTENVETSSSSDFRVVTKKKKTKKRRSSVSGSRRKTANASLICANSSKSDGDRGSSPVVPRRKSACSVPHSEKSNDSSDVDSVHSLPIDPSQRMDTSLNAEEAPISYADIARNSERKLHEIHKKISPDSKNSKDGINDPTSPETTRLKGGVSLNTSDAATAPPNEILKVVTTQPVKALPPDVHNIKSFPAIHVANNKTNKVEKANNKGGNVKSQHGRQQTMVQCNNVANVDRNFRNHGDGNTARVGAGDQSDIQNNLSIIQASEIETIQFNSQIIPTIHIPDVQTIEKIHFMNQPGAHMPAHLQQHVVPAHHLHMALTHTPIPMIPINDMFANGRPPAAYTAIISHTPHQPGHPGVTYVKAAQAYEGVSVAYVDHAYMTPKSGSKDANSPQVVVENQNSNLVTVVTQQTSNVETKNVSLSNCSKSLDNEHADSGNSGKQNKSKYNKRSQPSNNNNNPGAEQVNDAPTVQNPTSGSSSGHSSSTAINPTVIAKDEAKRPSQIRDEQTVSSNCDTRTSASDCASSEDSSIESRPPVVILSGSSNKEVPGLVFGFDVNEELLSEDICENFVQRFVTPPTYTSTSHNHEKIVNFIGSTWEDVRKYQSVGKAQYYSDSV